MSPNIPHILPTPLPSPLAALRAPLLAAVRRTAPVWLRDDAEDLTHVALMRLSRQLQRDPERPLTGAYLSRIAYTTVVDEIRRRKRERKLSARAVEIAEVPSPAPGPDQQADESGAAQAIQSCLEQAAPRTRDALTLYLLGHSVPEISRLLELGRKVSENVVYRGLTALRRCLRSRGYTP
jgi:RNA polymerase sigma-70 factor (ECF subfamily)